MSEKPLKENYLSWDSPIRLTLDLNLHIGDDKVTFFGLPLPRKWGASLRWELESGKRYTQLIDIEREIYDDGNPNAQIAAYWNQLDLRIYKYVNIFGVTLTAQLEVENVLDAQIPRIINPYTGLEYRPGDILTSSYTRDFNPIPNPINNPSKYRWPRRIRFGLAFRF